MAGPWEEFAQPDSSGPWSEFSQPTENKKQNKGILGDIGTGIKRGVEQMPGMVTGIADIAAAPISAATGVNRPFSRGADWLGEQTGFQPSKWAEEAAQEYSPEMQQSLKNVQDAKGFLPTLGAIAQNPRTAVNLVAESLPSTLAGGLLAKGAMGAVAGAEKLAAMKAAGDTAGLLKAGAIAGGIGEGAVTAGHQMAQTDYNVDPLKAAGAAVGSGIVTGAIGAGSGRLASSAIGRKLGLTDIESSIAAGTLGQNLAKAGPAAYAKRIGAGVIQEGLIEEAPQSYSEQVWQNLANGKPWNEGAAEAAAQGAVAGGVMGGGINAIPRFAGDNKEDEAPPIVPPPIVPLPKDSITLITDPAPIQGRIDAMLGIGDKPMNDAQKAQYSKDLNAAFSEVVGYVAGKDSIEVPVTMEDYLRSTVATADIGRAQQAQAEQPIATPEIPVSTIPVVGPLSKVGRAVDQAQITQQAVAEQSILSGLQGNQPRIQMTEAEGDALVNRAIQRADIKTATGIASRATTPQQQATTAPLQQAATALTLPGGITRAAQPAPLEQKAPQANAAQVGATAPAAQGTGQAIDLTGRTDAQLTYLTQHGKNGHQEAAVAELQRRGVQVSQVQQPAKVVSGKQKGGKRIAASADRSTNISRLQKELEGATPMSRRESGVIGRLITAVTDDATKSIDEGTPPAYTTGNGTFIVIHPSAQKDGMIQVTRYAENGVFGDSQYNNIEDAIRDNSVWMKRRISGEEAASALNNSAKAEAEYQQRKEEPKADKESEKAANRTNLEKARAKKSGPQSRDDLVGAILRVTGGKGIHPKMAQTIVGDKANAATKVRGLFTLKGQQDLDDIADLLRTEENYDVSDGNHLAELVREQAAGNPVYSMERNEREASENEARKYRDEIRSRASALGIKTVAVKFDSIERAVLEAEAKQAQDEAQAERDAIQAEEAVAELDDDQINVLLDLATQEDKENGRYINEQWISNDEILDTFDGTETLEEPEDAQGAARAGEAVAGEAGGNRPGRGDEARFDLAAQTNTQAAEQFAQQQTGEPASPTKAQADRERDAVPFSLGMQSQPKPQGVQTGLFTADGRASVAASQEQGSKKVATNKVGVFYSISDAEKALVGKPVGNWAVFIAGGEGNLFSDTGPTTKIALYSIGGGKYAGGTSSDSLQTAIGNAVSEANERFGIDLSGMLDTEYAKQERGEAGAALTKEQRKSVLKTLVDVYRQKNAPREMKGVDSNGNEHYGYVHSPELFEKSDITGAMVRYYVTLPDGRIAHPTELFADYTQADIDTAMQKEIDAARLAESSKKSRAERIERTANADLNEARVAEAKPIRAAGREVPQRFVEFYSEDEGKWVVFQDKEVSDRYKDELAAKGYREVATYSNDAGPNQRPNWKPKTYVGEATQQKPAEPVAQKPVASLEEIASRLGITVERARGGFHASSDGKMVSVPQEDKDAEGALSANHILAHELGHAVIARRGMNFNGIPVGVITKQYAPNWIEFVGASKAFRPGVWNHTNEKIRKHAKKPTEVLADAIASVLMGSKPVSMLKQFMDNTGTTLSDLGLQSVEEANSEYAKQKQSDSDPVAQPKAEPAKAQDGDWLNQLFGQAPSADQVNKESSEFVNAAQEKAGRVDAAIAMLTGEIEANNAVAAELAARKYKANRKQIELQGDGPGRNGSMSISAINESRKRRAIEASLNASSAIKKAIELISENPDYAFKQVLDMETAVTKQFNEGFFGKSAKLDDRLDMAVGSLIDSGGYSGAGSAGRKLRMAAHAYFAEESQGEAKAQEPATKEPWQMTRERAVWEEYAPDGMSTDRALAARLAKWEKIKRVAGNVSMESVDRAIANEKARIERANAHRAAVEKATAEGKPVPANVLADYTDLKPAPVDAVKQPETKAAEQESKPAEKDAVSHEDVGGEMTYNKRNRLNRALKWEDVQDKEAALRVSSVVKSKVVPKPDYQAMIDEGMEPLIAYMVKTAYDSLPTKPVVRGAPTDEQLQLYITAMNRYMDGVMAWAKNPDSVRAFIAKIAKRASVLRAMQGGAMTDLSALTETPDGKTLLDTVYPGDSRLRFGTGGEHHKEASILGNKALGGLQPSTDEAIKAMKEIENGWPSKSESWQRQGYSVKPSDGLVSVKREDYAGNEYFVVINGRITQGNKFATKEEAEKAASEVKPYLLLDKYGRVVSQHDTEDLAIESAREKVKRESKPDQIKEEGIIVAAAERIGPARRNENEDISTERIQEVFGFGKVNFGNWMKGDTPALRKERQLHLNHIYDSFLDLADILGIPPKAMSLNGLLSVAVGAQGQGKALAHFVPGVNEINITRRAGAGALAHEWGHALDHNYARLAGLERIKDPFLTEHTARLRGSRIVTENGRQRMVYDQPAFAEALRHEMLEKFRAVVQAMNKRMETQEEAIEREKSYASRVVSTAESWMKSVRRDFDIGRLQKGLSEETKTAALAELDKLFDRMRALDFGDGYVKAGNDGVFPVVDAVRKLYKSLYGRTYSIDQSKGINSSLASLKYSKEEKNTDHTPQQVSSDYYRQSASADKETNRTYWNTNLEKFARAFDAFVTDTISERAAKNTYLSGLEAVAPAGEERKAINAAIRDLVSEFKVTETDQGTALGNLADDGETAGDRIEAEVLRWSEVVGDYLAKRLDRTKTHVLLSSTPASMQAIGLPDLQVRTGPHMMDYANARLTRKQMDGLPRELANPLAVYIHDGDNGQSINIVTSIERNGEHLVIALKPNQHVKEPNNAHFVATVVNVRSSRIVGEFKNGNGLYVESKNSLDGLRDAIDFAQKENGRRASEVREQMSRSYNIASLVKRLVYKSDLVNAISAGRAKFSGLYDANLSPADKAIYGMVAEGNSAADILKFIASTSRNPFYRQLAKLLQKTGIAPQMTLGEQSNWKMNAGNDKTYAAAYDPKTNTIALFRAASSERNVLHELMHAASIKALEKNGLASTQMKMLFKHVKQNGESIGLFYDKATGAGVYGIADIDEFMAEAFSNPKFQELLKQMPAPKSSNLKRAWDWFVNIVRGILGLPKSQENALSKALEIGLGVMRENMALNAAQDGTARGNIGGRAAVDQTETPEFKRWFGDYDHPKAFSSKFPADKTPPSMAMDWEANKPLKLFHATNNDFDVFETGRESITSTTFGPIETRRHAIFTTPDPKFAESYLKKGGGQNVMPVYMDIKAPMDLRNNGAWDYVDELVKNGFENHRWPNRSDTEMWEMFDDETGEAFVAAAKKAGYDGAIMFEVDDNDKMVEVYVAFDPTQIKSATGNRGTFDPTNPDIRYNIADDIRSHVPPMIQKQVSLAFDNQKSTSWLTAVNTQYHKALKWAGEGKPMFKRVFDLGQEFVGDVSRFSVMAQNKAPTMFHEWQSVGDVAKAIRNTRSIKDITGKNAQADIDAAAKPLFEGTLAGGGNPMEGVRFSDAELRSKYQLTDKQIKLYNEALDAVNVSMDELAKSIIAKHAKNNGLPFDSDMSVEDMAADVSNGLDALREEALMRDDQKAADLLEKTMKDVTTLADKNQKLQDHGYFPLMRFGDHTVTATDAEGKVQYFNKFEGVPLIPKSAQYQMNKEAERLKAEHPEWTVRTGIQNTEAHKMYGGLNIDALKLFADHMDAESKAPYQEFLRVATNERSVMKRMMHRKGTPGYSEDARRTLASFIVSNARAASSNYHLFDMRKATAEAEQDGGDIGREAVKLFEEVSNPVEAATKLRGFLFFNYLGGSIASAAINMTQIPMMTFPKLSQYAKVNDLVGMLGKAAKMAVMNPANVQGELGKALRQAEMDGVTAPQEIFQLTGTAANSIFTSNKGANFLLQAWGKPFALAEAFNRRTTFIAAYQIAQKMTPAQLKETGAKSAFEFAETMVKETQGIYNAGNRPNIGRGAVGATMMTFKQYSIMYMELLSRLPLKQQAMMMGMLLLAAGAGGLPFEEDAEDIIDTIGQWMGYATNTRKSLRNAVEGAIGKDAADIALNGVLDKMGISLSARIGMHNLLPGSGVLKQSSIDKSRDVQEFFGPAASVIASFGKALENLATGHPDRAALAMAPVAVQNAVRGINMMDTGYAEDLKGRRTIPVSGMEGFAKSLGFNPKSVAQFGDIKRDLSQDQRLMQVRREAFTSAMADAIISGDMDAREQAVSDMKEWNLNNPNHRVMIDMRAVAQRVRAAKMEGVARFLKSTPKTMRADAIGEFSK